MRDPSTWPSAGFKRVEWPRLSETLPHREPGRCNACGVEGNDMLVGGNLSATPSLTTWQECDRDDRPEARYVLLCRPCGERLIDPHPRLYRALPRFTPAPGAMPICGDCAHRDGCRCASPSARYNGGEGILIHGPAPSTVHVLRADEKGRRCGSWEQWYPGPSTRCTGKEPVP